jgi:hypothetical protein
MAQFYLFGPSKYVSILGYLSQYYGGGGGGMSASSMASQFMASSGMMYTTGSSGSSGGSFTGLSGGGNPPPSLSPMPVSAYASYGGSGSVSQSAASIIGAMT